MRTAYLAAAVFITVATAQDAKEYSAAYEAGRSMNRSSAAEFEKKVSKRPNDLIARTHLIAFYTFSPAIDAVEAIPARRKHLLWLTQEHPESWLWSQRSYGTAVYPEGGRLLDREGFQQMRDVWLKHISSRPDSMILENASRFLLLGDRQTALGLIRKMPSARYLGTAFAVTLLGITARDFDTGEPLAADQSVRESELGKQIIVELEQTTDPQLIGGTGFWLSRDGAMLWTKGHREWDYSPLAKTLLARARSLEPNRLDWFVANPELPKPDEMRGVNQIRVGGTVMSDKIVHLVKPDVPTALASIKGTVSLNIAVGQDGRVIKAVATDGPKELYDISVKAVEQWVYKPTILNGTPVIVLSAVNITFQ